MSELNVCDHGHDTYDEIRRLPIGGGAGVLVCHQHYENEMDGGEGIRPPWNALDVVATAKNERWDMEHVLFLAQTISDLTEHEKGAIKRVAAKWRIPTREDL